MSFNRGLLVATVLLATASSALAQGGPAPVTFDNQKGRYLNFEVGAIQPLAFGPGGTTVYALNQQGWRLVVLDATTLAVRSEIPIGLGASSVVPRPSTNEAWVVDRVGGCVSVVDVMLGAIVRTIRVGGEPHALVFSPSGDRAYVTCSAVDRVDVIDVAEYRVVRQIQLPARTPRGIAYSAGRAWVASFLSGNNTAGRGTLADPEAIERVARVEGPGVVPLPDLDLFAIEPATFPANDALDSSATRTGLGTVLFNVHARPGTTELWIPNTDALNADVRGEANFVDGRVVRNRITIVDATGALPPRILDLDELAPSDVKCAQPTSVAFDPVRPRAYVTGYGSDLVAVLEKPTSGEWRWAGAITLPPKQSYPRGTQPRACIVDAAGAQLYVWNKNDTSLAKIDLATLPASGPFVVASPLPRALGFEGSSTEERLGRHLFADARHSPSKTSSCASCHVDGHTDGLVWDLSHFADPEGTPSESLTYGIDVKGPMVTQSTRRMEESGPYHWRGEKRSINDFNASFSSLLDMQDAQGNADDVGPDFQYLRHYVNRIAYPPNPRMQRDRVLTPDQAAGATIFQTKPVLGSLTCASCHTLPLGTRGEVVAEAVAGMIHSADVPQLRGVEQKRGQPWVAGGAFGTRPELGAGLTHAGAYATFEDVVQREDPAHSGLPRFNLTPGDAAKVVAFLEAFDTGLAPSTATQATLHAGNASTFAATELAFLKSQAEAGHCDLVAMRTPAPGPAGSLVARSYAYDRATRKWLPASRMLGPIDEAPFFSEAVQGRPVTFLGVPLGMGRSVGIDRDSDGLFDLDERRAGTNPDRSDTDGDKMPDGYEVLWGLDPLATTAGSPDSTAPSLVGPARLVYATTNTLKVEFTASEMCRVHVALNGGPPVQRIPLDHQVDTEHWVVLGGLEPGTAYTITFEMRDPAGNIFADTSTTFSTLPRTLPAPMRIDGIALSIVQVGAQRMFLGDVDLGTTAGASGSSYVVRGSLFLRTQAGALQMLAPSLESVAGTSGVAGFRVPLPPSVPSGTLTFVVREVLPPAQGGVPYVMAYDTEFSESIGL